MLIFCNNKNYKTFKHNMIKFDWTRYLKIKYNI